MPETMRVTSPFTIDIDVGCCVGRKQGKYAQMSLTWKTETPIVKNKVGQGIEGTPVRCSIAQNCPYSKNEDCFLKKQHSFTWYPEKPYVLSFAKLTPEALERIIKNEGWKIVKKKGFLRSISTLGLSWATVCRVIEPYLPKGKERARFLATKKRLLEIPVRQNDLDQFVKANGYEIVRTQGISAGASASGLRRDTVRKIMVQHPPRIPFVTDWQRKRIEGSLKPQKWWMPSVTKRSMARFINAHGYELAEAESAKAAAIASKLSPSTVGKILKHYPTLKDYFKANPESTSLLCEPNQLLSYGRSKD